MPREMKPCIFGCKRVTCNQSQICPTCNQGLRYWEDKDHDQIVKREEQLEVLSNRMHRLSAPRRSKSRAASKAIRHEARA